jgi:hypothetical protein
MSKRVQTSSETSASPVQTTHSSASTPGINLIHLNNFFEKTKVNTLRVNFSCVKP